jgi:glycosyltransferase involved in cell wall biosynthesis
MPKKALTLSIVIPVYNEQDHIGKCLDAIMTQSVIPDEVIVVDNNCSDNSINIAKSFAGAKIIHENNQGIVYARNAGFNASKSDIIARIDADTIVPHNWVKDILEQMQELPDMVAVTGPCSFRGKIPHFLTFWAHRMVYFWSSRLLFGHQTLFGSNMFVSRRAWRKVNNSVCLRNDIHEDMDLAVHLNLVGVPIIFNKDFKASVCNRRFKNWSHYPKMWLKTKLVH